MLQEEKAKLEQQQRLASQKNAVLETQLRDLQQEKELAEQVERPAGSVVDYTKENERIKHKIQEDILTVCPICHEILTEHDENKMPHTTKCQVACL